MTAEDRTIMELRRIVDNHPKSLLPSKIGIYIRMKFTPRIAPKRLQSFEAAGHEGQIETILNLVCSHFNIPWAQLVEGNRKRHLVYARQVCMYLLRKHTGMTLLNIGRKIGHRDHTTVIHSLEQLSDIIDTEDAVREEIDFLNSKIK